jgi:hypothetical protein
MPVDLRDIFRYMDDDDDIKTKVLALAYHHRMEEEEVLHSGCMHDIGRWYHELEGEISSLCDPKRQRKYFSYLCLKNLDAGKQIKRYSYEGAWDELPRPDAAISKATDKFMEKVSLQLIWYYPVGRRPRTSVSSSP